MIKLAALIDINKADIDIASAYIDLRYVINIP